VLVPKDYDVFQALENDYDVEVSCVAYLDNVRVPVPLTVTGGNVTMTAGTGTRAVLDVTFAPAPGLRDALAPSGLLLRPEWIIRWGATGVERVTWGEFLVDEEGISYDASSGGVRVTAPDTWAKVPWIRLPPQVAEGDPYEVAARWVREAHRSLTGEVLPYARRSLRPKLYGGDNTDGTRTDAVRELLNVVGAQAFIDRRRRLIIEPRPQPGTAAPRWTSSPWSTLLGADETRSGRDVINSYTVHPDRPGLFPPFCVQDTDPASPTRITGPMGVRGAQKPLIFPGADQPLARLGAEAELAKTTATAFTTSFSAAPNPFLDPDDGGPLTFPEQGGADGDSIRPLIDKVVHPLIPDEGVRMTVDVRSNQPPTRRAVPQ